MEDPRRKNYDCQTCKFQEQRNCEGRYPKTRFKFQLLNKIVIYQCPSSHFDDWLYLLHRRLFELSYFKKFNISVSPQDIAMIELEACSILDSELSLFHQEQSEKELEKRGSNGKSNIGNRVPDKGR